MIEAQCIEYRNALDKTMQHGARRRALAIITLRTTVEGSYCAASVGRSAAVRARGRQADFAPAGLEFPLRHLHQEAQHRRLGTGKERAPFLPFLAVAGACSWSTTGPRSEEHTSELQSR